MVQAYNVFLLLGGIGLFLFGINFMGDGLEKAAGDNMRDILQKLTQNGPKAVLIGIVTTAVIQSSGATMVMTAGFVNAQLMSLKQGLYVMLGAAIGTTITAQIIAFDIAGFAPLILFFGVLLYLFTSHRSLKKAGAVVLGFGVLFMGIYVMKEAVAALNLGPMVEEFLKRVQHPLLSFLFGFALTFVIQSSSASVGILQVIMAGSSAVGFTLASVVYIILGMNVGALAPLIISSFRGGRAAKRAAASQTILRLLSVLVFLIVMFIFPGIFEAVEKISPGDASRQIANLHLIFNIIGCAALMPLISPVADLAMKAMPDDPEDEYWARKLLYVGGDLRKAPAAIIRLSREEVIRFGKLCVSNLKLALNCFFAGDENAVEKVIDHEKTIDFLDREINKYLVTVYGMNFSRKELEEIGAMFKVVSDFERIADHAENIAEYEQTVKSMGARISSDGVRDLKRMAKRTAEALDLAVRCFSEGDEDLYRETEIAENEIDDLSEELMANHIERLQKGICEPRGGVIYTDFVSDLERCSDHAMNIAESIFGRVRPEEKE